MPHASKKRKNKKDSRKDNGRTTLSLSLTIEDKKALKILAAERGTTIAAVIHEWIADHTGTRE